MPTSDGRITHRDLCDGVVLSRSIKDSAVTTTKINDASITNAKINDLSADKINAGTLSAARIAAGTISAEKFVLRQSDNLVENPGFEAGDLGTTTATNEGYLDASAGSWYFEGGSADQSCQIRKSSDGVENIHSGDYCAYLQVSASPSWPTGRVALHTAYPYSPEGNVAVGSGDVVYVRVWLGDRGTAPTGWTGCRLMIWWRDAAGSVVSTSNGSYITAGDMAAATTAAGGITTSFEHEATCPAGAAYANVGLELAEDGTWGGTYAICIDDWLVRRKSTSGEIKDQAVDIQRMLNPVHADTIETSSSANDSLTTSYQKVASSNFSIPSWVGEAAVLCFAYSQLTNSSGGVQAILPSARIGGVDDGAAIQDVQDGGTGSATHIDERVVSSPGSTLEIACYTRVSVGTNSANSSTAWGYLIGVR